MSFSFAEENYIKAIFHLSNWGEISVSTNSIADQLNTKPASVSDMIKKLANKGVINYRKYQGVEITSKGKSLALQVIRKHRLWEVFLVEKLRFKWDEVHEIAEQLEHVKSPRLTDKLDEFLGYPKVDPHGDPIPNKNGEVKVGPKLGLSQMEEGSQGTVVQVDDSNPAFLKYLDKIGIYIGARIKVNERVEFDGSLELIIDNNQKQFVSSEAANNILVAKE
ncbi:MAG: metal-dependent transcriptional regulator [Cyclobacteriaceae bacterium]